MGSAATRHSSSEINMLEQNTSNRRNIPQPYQSDDDDDGDEDVSPKSAQVTIETCLKFFYFKEPSEISLWACERASHAAADMSRICVINENKKRLSTEDRKEVASLCLNRDIPNLYLKYLQYISEDMKEVFIQDEQIIKALSYNNNNNNNAAKRERFGHLVYAQKITCSMLAHMVNVSDVDRISVNRYVKIGVVKWTVGIIQVFYPVIEEYTTDVPFTEIGNNARLRILSHALSILHNVSKTTGWSILSEDGLVKILPFLKSEVQLFAMKSLLTLSYLITEQNNHLVVSSQKPITLLLQYTRNSMKRESRRFLGFSLTELLEGLTRIAQNDENKKLLGEQGAIQIISLVFDSGQKDGQKYDGEIIKACQVLHQLSFIEENREQILNESVIMDAIKKLKESGNQKIVKAVNGLSWELVGKHSRESENKDCEKRNTKESNTTEASLSQHIMISYQWDHQSTILKVRDKLQNAGYKVWLDIDQMGGSTLEAMGTAVEESHLFLMTVSSRYKESSNCRSEAEYAFQLKKTIIPLMFEEDYTADGWLGFIVGAKFWIDFRKAASIENSLTNLVREVTTQTTTGERDSENLIEKNDNKDTLKPRQRQNQEKIDLVKSWRHADVYQWIRSIEFEHVISEECVVKSLNGDVLIHLKDLKEQNLDTLFRLLKEYLHLESLIHLFKFTEELEKLFT